jgi:ribosome maturation factor RimP
VAKQNVAATVTDLLQPIFKESEVELVEVTYTKEGNEWYLRVFIDKPGGVDIEDCQNISRIIDPLLDEKDPVPHHYTLEVSSPGLERPLKKPDDYERFRDRLANITTYVPIEGKKNFKGYLSGMRDNNVVLKVKSSELLIPFEQIAGARLEAEFK